MTSLYAGTTARANYVRPARNAKSPSLGTAGRMGRAASIAVQWRPDKRQRRAHKLSAPIEGARPADRLRACPGFIQDGRLSRLVAQRGQFCQCIKSYGGAEQCHPEPFPDFGVAEHALVVARCEPSPNEPGELGTNHHQRCVRGQLRVASPGPPAESQPDHIPLPRPRHAL